jgi:hypothetical protein
VVAHPALKRVLPARQRQQTREVWAAYDDPRIPRPCGTAGGLDRLGLDYLVPYPADWSRRMKDDPELIHDVIHALSE